MQLKEMQELKKSKCIHKGCNVAPKFAHFMQTEDVDYCTYGEDEDE
jgi:hypothetical protein